MIGRVVGARFEVERPAGSGGMATVYRARDLADGRPVALKLVRLGGGRAAERFDVEAAVLARLGHPAIVRYIAHGVAEAGARYLAMEWLDGEDLGGRLERRPLTVNEALAAAQRAAEALAHAHERDVVHRDLKPENLFLPDGDVERLKLLDFGIARLARGARRLTLTGSVIGTPGYMAPEVLRGDADATPAADIFSLGCVLFQSLTGRRVFEGDGSTAVLAKILLQPAPRLQPLAPQVPAALDDLVAQMLAKDPLARPADGRALVEALEAVTRASQAPGGRARTRVPALTAREQRVACVVMAGASAVALRRWLRDTVPLGPGRDGANAGAADAGDAEPGGETSDTSETLETSARDRPTAAGDGGEDEVVVADAGNAMAKADAEGEAVARANTDADASAKRNADAGAGADAGAAADAHAEDSAAPPSARLAEELGARFGVRVHALPDGALVATMIDGGRGPDQAARAARAALAMRRVMPDVPIAVVTGPARFSAGAVAGEVIDAGARLLRATPAGAVRLDDMAAGMLDGRFELQREGTALYLRAERDRFDDRRNLLGKTTEFVGRGREISLLGNLLASVSTEARASAILVTGAAGIGKSRLRHEFVDWVQRQPARTELLFAAGDSVAAGAPFGMVGQAIRRAAGIHDGDPPEERRRKLGVRVARRVPPESQARVTALLGEIADVRFPDDASDALKAARGNPQLMGDGVRRAFEDWLAAESAAAPVLVILEDLHWGDGGTVRLIDGALRALRDGPLMVLALARPEVTALYPGLWEQRELQTLRLAPLSRRAAERLVLGALGDGAPPALVAEIAARADGNPLYLEELIRAHAAGRAEGLPDSVVGMVQARLDSEGPEAKRVLRAASVFGERFTAGGVAALLGGEGERRGISEWLEQLGARELVAPSPGMDLGGERELTFAHALVREAAYAMLTDEDRLLGHRLAGAHLEQRGAAPAMAVAEHFRRGGEPARAVRHYQGAAEQALAANDLEGAIARAELGVACGAEGEQAGELRLTQAEAHVWRGEPAAAERRALEAVGALPPGSATWLRAQGQAIVAAAKRGNLDLVEAQVDQVLRAAPDFGARNAEITCLAWATSYLVLAGRLRAADRLLGMITELVGDLADVGPEARALIHQAEAVRASAAGDRARCLGGLEAALAAFEEAGDLRNGCAVRSDLASVYAELGDFARAEAMLRQALVAADRMGLHDVTARVQQSLGRVLGLGGRLVEAEALERQAVQSFERQGDPRLEGVARTHLAAIVLAAGRADEALAEAGRAETMLAVAPALLVGAAATRARALLAIGEEAAALEAARQAFSALVALGPVDDGEAAVRLVYAECLARTGAEAEARAMIGVARDRLLRRAERIVEASWRDRFLHDVPDHARTLALAAAWLGDRATG